MPSHDSPASPDPTSGSPLPANLKRAVVARSLLCRQCGYDVRGVRLDSACPECGLPVRATVIAEIDPDASDLPRLHHPRAVGNGLLWLTACLMLAAVSLTLPKVLAGLAELAPLDALEHSILADPVLLAGGAVFAAAGLAACLSFFWPRRPPNDPVAGRDVRMIATGLLLIAAVALTDWLLERSPVGAIGPYAETRDALVRHLVRLGLAEGAIVTFTGLGGVMEIIGARSRVYRESAGGRQSIRAMNWAVLLVIGGTFVGMIAIALRLHWLELTGGFIAGVSMLMVVIGLGYLVMNAWWIRQALTRPPLRLRDVIRIEADTTAMEQGRQEPPGNVPTDRDREGSAGPAPGTNRNQ